MKQRVELSAYSFIVTVVCLVVLLVTVFIVPEPWWMYSWGSFIGVILILSLCYCPLSVEVTDKDIRVNRALSLDKRLPLEHVGDVRLCPPTMGEIRVCGSGGFLGYWGWFRERDLGKYFAYYGKSSDCFLVTLKDGRKYMLGCKNAPLVVEHIKNNIGNKSQN